MPLIQKPLRPMAYMTPITLQSRTVSTIAVFGALAMPLILPNRTPQLSTPRMSAIQMPSPKSTPNTESETTAETRIMLGATATIP